MISPPDKAPPEKPSTESVSQDPKDQKEIEESQTDHLKTDHQEEGTSDRDKKKEEDEEKKKEPEYKMIKDEDEEKEDEDKENVNTAGDDNKGSEGDDETSEDDEYTLLELLKKQKCMICEKDKCSCSEIIVKQQKDQQQKDLAKQRHERRKGHHRRSASDHQKQSQQHPSTLPHDNSKKTTSVKTTATIEHEYEVPLSMTRRSSAICSDLITFLEAKENFRKTKAHGWNIYSDFPRLAAEKPYFLLDPEGNRHHQDSLKSRGLHLVICVHGLDGNSADLRLVKTYLELGLPDVPFEFLMSQRLVSLLVFILDDRSSFNTDSNQLWHFEF